MVSHAINAPIKQAPEISAWVWFTGSTALAEGQGVCYDWDYDGEEDSCATFDGRRLNRVELPSITNARWFAGVAARAYAAVSTGQMIEIYLPGSCCNILSKANTTIGVGILTCEAGGTYAGYWRYAGFQGEGSAVPLQTVNRSGTAGKCQALLQTGLPSGLVESVVTNADGLLDGGATTFMVGGVSYIDANISTGGNATATLADGTVPDIRKAFVCRAAQTTGAVVITVTSGVEGIANADPRDALANITLNADLEETMLQWNAFDTNGLWVILHTVGADIA